MINWHFIEDLEQAHGVDAGINGALCGRELDGVPCEDVSAKPRTLGEHFAGFFVPLILQQAQCKCLAQGNGVIVLVTIFEQGCAGEHLSALDEAEGGTDDQELARSVELHGLHQRDLAEIGIHDGRDGYGPNVDTMLTDQEQQ